MVVTYLPALEPSHLPNVLPRSSHHIILALNPSVSTAGLTGSMALHQDVQISL